MHLDTTPQWNIIGFRCVGNGALKDENLMSKRFSVDANTKNVPLHPNTAFYLQPDPLEQFQPVFVGFFSEQFKSASSRNDPMFVCILVCQRQL